jgi:type II secretory pathway pseudopilin PulG
MKKTYNIILHILAIIGAILFFTSCNDSERDKQRTEQKKITQAIEKRIDSLRRQNESDKIWRNQ